MTTWRAAARFSCAATDLLLANTKRASQCTSRLVLAPAISHSGPSGLLSQQEALQRHFVRGFAANTGSRAGSTPPPPPVAPIEDTDAEDTDAEEYNFSDSEVEDFQPDTEDFEAADSGADEPESDQLEAVESGAQGPIDTGQLQMPTIEGVSQEEQDALLQQIQSSSKKQQRHILQQLLTGNKLMGAEALGDDSSAAELAEQSQHYSLKLVNVNSTNKGTKSGGVQSFSAMVVVGNHEGLLGHGTGKAAELVPAIRKASLRAMNNLSYVPRYESFTILHPVDTKYGKCKLRMYPLASGRGIRANDLLGTIADLAGINAIGIKTHGSRNARNSVKAMFQAFAQLTTIERRAQELGVAVAEVVAGSRPAPNPRRYRYAQRLSK